jgi:hypothetical protein
MWYWLANSQSGPVVVPLNAFISFRKGCLPMKYLEEIKVKMWSGTLGLGSDTNFHFRQIQPEWFKGKLQLNLLNRIIFFNLSFNVVLNKKNNTICMCCKLKCNCADNYFLLVTYNLDLIMAFLCPEQQNILIKKRLKFLWCVLKITSNQHGIKN